MQEVLNNNNLVDSSENLELLCVQKYPEYIDQCIELLNSQWPRSKTARLVSIKQGSSDGFPTSLILIDRKSGPGNEKVVAHSKISLLQTQLNACFVESVVVAASERGKGLGRLMMEKTEAFVKSKGITHVYLTTHDQQGFYERIGYVYCENIVVGGGSHMLNSIILKHAQKNGTNNSSSLKNSSLNQNQANCKEKFVADKLNDNNLTSVTKGLADVCIAPPPPPLPPNNKMTPRESTAIITNHVFKVTMKKYLL